MSASNRSNFSSNNVYLSYYIEIFVVESRVGSIDPSLVCTNLFILFDNVFLALADSVISQVSYFKEIRVFKTSLRC